MILSLSHSPDAQQSRGMASHGQSGRVQHGTRAHSAPRHQVTPSWLPTSSRTAASAHSRPGPTRPMDPHTGRARTAQPGSPTGSTRALARPMARTCPIVSAHVARAAGAGPNSRRDIHGPQPAAELHTGKCGEERQHERSTSKRQYGLLRSFHRTYR